MGNPNLKSDSFYSVQNMKKQKYTRRLKEEAGWLKGSLDAP